MYMVSDSIKKLRKERKLTHDQLAQQLNVTTQSVIDWEIGKTQPDIETLTKLAEVFEVSVERIIYGKSEKRFRFHVNLYPKKGLQMGAILAMVVSYAKWQSIGWAIVHSLLNWVYIIYYIIKY